MKINDVVILLMLMTIVNAAIAKTNSTENKIVFDAASAGF
jgi:hypothetical protein